MKLGSPEALSPYAFLGLSGSLRMPISSRASATAPQLPLRTLSPTWWPDPRAPGYSRDLSDAGPFVPPPKHVVSGTSKPRVHWLLGLCEAGVQSLPFSPSNWLSPICIHWGQRRSAGSPPARCAGPRPEKAGRSFPGYLG